MSTATATRSPVKARVPVDVIRKSDLIEAKFIEVSPGFYRALRSFVESSSKPKYMWNTGVKYGEGSVEFVKPGMWKLTINLIDEIHPDAPHIYNCPIILTPLPTRGRANFSICFKIEEDPIYYRKVVKMYASFDTLSGSEMVEFDSTEDLALRSHMIYSDKVMFARGITLYEIIKSIDGFVNIDEYRRKLQEALDEWLEAKSKEEPETS